jgi:hypothetical protein
MGRATRLKLMMAPMANTPSTRPEVKNWVSEDDDKLPLGHVGMCPDRLIVRHALIHRPGNEPSGRNDRFFEALEGFVRGAPLGDHARRGCRGGSTPLCDGPSRAVLCCSFRVLWISSRRLATTGSPDGCNAGNRIDHLDPVRQTRRNLGRFTGNRLRASADLSRS